MKAILIIDIDDDLLEDYENFDVDYELRADKKNENYNACIRYVEDCRLKSMPRKMAVEHRWFSEDFARGYNLCIDEILGEEQ